MRSSSLVVVSPNEFWKLGIWGMGDDVIEGDVRTCGFVWSDALNDESNGVREAHGVVWSVG